MIRFPRRTTRVEAWIALCLLSLLVLGAPAKAQISVDVTEGTFSPLSIAIPEFQADGGGSFAQDIPAVITNNLQTSGLFAPIDPSAFIQDADSLQAGPRFGDWRLIGTEALVRGRVSEENDGRLRVEFELWDVIAERRIEGQAYTAEAETWRRIAHIISDAIYTSITGEGGYFDTQIVYISESGPANERIKRLAIMDQDGANHRFLTQPGTLVLTPRFSPSTREITYLAYTDNRPRVYLFNIDTGRQEVLGDFPGMTFAPRFSPDGNRVIFSWAQSGNSDIYTMDLRTRTVSRLTTHPGIDTAPSFSPDGQQITFESDRGGSQQIYVMSAGGGDARRISFGDGSYGSPVWSPRGDLIAFTNLSGGQFRIGVMRPDGTAERILTQGFHVEGPTWSPNGRVLMYFTQASTGQGARAQLRSVDLTGRFQTIVPTPQDGSDPAWSPLNP